MVKRYSTLLVIALSIACDNSDKNQRMIQGEWVVNELSEHPTTISPNVGKLDIGSRVLFDKQGRIGIFLTDTTKKPAVYYYSISDDRLTIWITDYGVPYEIERLSNATLTIQRAIHGTSRTDSPRIKMIKAQ